MSKPKRFADHEMYFGAFMVLMGTVGVLWRLFLDFPSVLVLGFGMFVLLSESYRRMARRGLEYYFPALHNILFRESLFDLAFNQNHVTRFLRMMSRFAAIVLMRDLPEEGTKELLDGIDDAFLHRLFSPGVVSMVAPSRNSFPIDRKVALSIIQERKANPFRRPDMPYPFGITARRLLKPYIIGSVQIVSVGISVLMFKHFKSTAKASLVPLSVGTLFSIFMLSKKDDPPRFDRHYPDFHFRPLMGGLHPITTALIIKYRRFPL